MLIIVYLSQALPRQGSLGNADLASLISPDQFFSAVNVTAVWSSDVLSKALLHNSKA